MKVVFLIVIGFVILHSEFIKNGDIVIDSKTKLEWQDDLVGSNMEWEVAITHCEELTLGGYYDWRLPNINELKTIVDRSKVNPSIVDIFIHTSYNRYWSSTSRASDKHRAWVIHFGNGNVYPYYDKNDSKYVRCVRAGQ